MSDLPAGRELDALVAEKVMGLTVAGWGTAIHVEGEWSVQLDGDPKGWACHAGANPLCVQHCQCDLLDGAYWAENEAYIVEAMREEYPEFKGDETPEPKLGGHYQGCLAVVPHFSTDIAAAWLVVEKMAAECWYPDFGYGKCKSGGYWVALFDKADPEGRLISREVAPTAPHAICLAALRAVQG